MNEKTVSALPRKSKTCSLKRKKATMEIVPATECSGLPESSIPRPARVTAKQAYAQMIASAGNLGAAGSVLPGFALGRKTPGAS